MIISRTRSRLTVVASLLSAMTASGCIYLRTPRIDPTGERIFVEPPIVLDPQYRCEPGPRSPGDDTAVTLLPPATVAPLGSEVVLLAGVRGPDNCLRPNRRLEWSLDPGGVGHFVAVGKNRTVDLLYGDFNRPRKVDNSYAIGSTSREQVRLTRGTDTAEDDICVLPGQGWITLTSPVEGTSHVTVLAPGVYAWDCRLRAATIHWVDAQWCFPPPAINPAGTTHVLTSTVTRYTDQSPAAGWLVRYEIVGGPPAGFAPDGAQSVEVVTDDAGRAGVEIFQTTPGPGTNNICIQVIRPASLGGPHSRRLSVGGGSTLTTWTTADLAVRMTAQETAEVGATLSYKIEVSNPGDQPAENVVVTDELPESLEFLDSDPTAEITGRTLQWNLGQLGAGESRVIDLNCRAARQGSVTHCAEATGNGNALADGPLSASDCATTTVTAPGLDVTITGPSQATVGDDVTFRILVTNQGQNTLTGLVIRDNFDPGLEHPQSADSIEADLDDLAPGESQRLDDVTFRATRAGELCHTVEVTADDGSRGTARGCVTVVERGPGVIIPEANGQPVQPPPEGAGLPAVSIKKSGPLQAAVGERADFTIDVTNSGTQTLTEVMVVDTYPASLDPQFGSDGFRFEGENLVYTIDSLLPGETKTLKVVCQCVKPATRTSNLVVVTTKEGAQAEARAFLDIVALQSGLTIDVVDLADPVRQGARLTYKIVVTNNGTATEQNVSVTATLPLGMVPDPLGTTGPGGRTIAGQAVRFDPVAEILPGETREYRVVVQTFQPGQLTVRAELTSPKLIQPLSAEATTEVLQ
ncbi:MAG TPA: hypothetical protein VMY42_14185 [Thermoguttaceae bacterium]|nr:hypothetical protein [Thermoguttaceae bacterium]